MPTISPNVLTASGALVPVANVPGPRSVRFAAQPGAPKGPRGCMGPRRDAARGAETVYGRTAGVKAMFRSAARPHRRH